MRQLRAELRRFASRRLTRGLVLVAVGLLAVVGAVVFVQTDDEAELRRRVERDRAEQIALCIQYGVNGSDLVIGPNGEMRPSVPVTPGGPDYEQRRIDCERDYLFATTVDEEVADRRFAFVDLWPVPEPMQPETYRYVDENGVEREAEFEPDGGKVGWLAIPGLLLFLGALVVGASMIGADWQTGTFPTLLTWESRRLRLYAIKLVAAFVLAVIIAAALLVLFSAVLYPTALVKGTTEGMTGEWWRGVVPALGRSAIVTGLGALVGMGIAMVGRRTALAIGVLAAYLIVFENLVRGFRPQWQPWLLGNAITTSISAQRQRFWVDADRYATLEPGRAFTVLGAYALVAVATAAIVFVRRDVSAS